MDFLSEIKENLWIRLILSEDFSAKDIEEYQEQKRKAFFSQKRHSICDE